MFNWLYGSSLITKADRLSTYAAALAYCFVLSMVPFLAVTFALGMQISSRLDQQTKYAAQYAQVLSDIIPSESPRDTQRIFQAVQHSYSAQGYFVTIGFILAAYTSFNLMEQIIRTLLFIFDDPRLHKGWSWMVLFKTFALLLIWMMLLLLISISAVETAELQDISNRFIFPALTTDIVKVTQILIVIGALFGTFFLTYYLVPTKRYSTTLIVEGSLLASCGWVASSMAFAYLVPKLLATSPAYVALGSVVAILLWAQACAWSVIIGACWMVRFSKSK